MLIFDTETNGLLDTVTTLHCLVIQSTETGIVNRCNSNKPKQLEAAIRFLMTYTLDGGNIVAHNGIKFDIPVLQKLYPWFKPDMNFVLDTLVLARLVYPNIGDHDAIHRHKWELPNKCFGRHSLEAWGYRLGNPKAEYTGGWEKWSEEMEDYCDQDVSTLADLMQKLAEKNPSVDSIKLEHGVARIIARQETHGFLFDQDAAAELYSTLVSRRLELEKELHVTFTPFYLRDGKEFTPKSSSSKHGYTPGATLCKVKVVEFNPGSRDHIAHRLKHLHKWVPTEFTDGGKPKVDETVLASLPYPSARLLSEYMMVGKRVGQLAEGDEAWLRHVKADGRIHGGINPNGAVTGRMTHSRPNMGQVPASYSPYGAECRALFTVPKGKILVGADASALELRALAGYMAKYDEGKYIKTVVDGKKEDGTEIHTVNRKALQIESRDDAKTWFYAFIYGAGDHKMGTTLLKQEELKDYYLKHEEEVDRIYKQRKPKDPTFNKRGAVFIHRGKESRSRFMKNLPALKALVDAVQAKVKKAGHLVGLDGRILSVRSSHSALNTLLQSAGAVLMKKALVILDLKLQAAGFIPGTHYEFVANVHDEWQIEADEDKGEAIGHMAIESMEEAGRYYNFRCPITGEFRTGRNWAGTH